MPYADLVWCETSQAESEAARQFAEAIHAKFPGKLLAYNCSPSFNWKKNWTTAPLLVSNKSCQIWAIASSLLPWRFTAWFLTWNFTPMRKAR